MQGIVISENLRISKSPEQLIEDLIKFYNENFLYKIYDETTAHHMNDIKKQISYLIKEHNIIMNPPIEKRLNKYICSDNVTIICVRCGVTPLKIINSTKF